MSSGVGGEERTSLSQFFRHTPGGVDGRSIAACGRVIFREQSMKLEELKVYQLAMALGDDVWAQVSRWRYFEKDTIGKQLVKAADSVAANLSEGFGRFFYKENRQFGYYARGSLYETRTWITKAQNRQLIEKEKAAAILKQVEDITIKLNNYIRSIGSNATVKETTTAWPKASDHLSPEKIRSDGTQYYLITNNDGPMAPQASIGPNDPNDVRAADK
jgi:four helix bundle protein